MLDFFTLQYCDVGYNTRYIVVFSAVELTALLCYALWGCLILAANITYQTKLSLLRM
jgi:hypothetical protein